MGRIPASYIGNRLVTFALTVFIAATLIWIIPRLSPVDPVDVMMGRMAAGGGTVENSGAILAQLTERFGLDQPLAVQYLLYLKNTLTFDFGLSTANFPTPVATLIAYALPWTLRAHAHLARHHLLRRQPPGRADGVGADAAPVEGGDPRRHGLHLDPADPVGAAPDVPLLHAAGVVSADRRLWAERVARLDMGFRGIGPLPRLSCPRSPSWW
jgi:hypothetical protein